MVRSVLPRNENERPFGGREDIALRMAWNEDADRFVPPQRRPVAGQTKIRIDRDF